MNLSRMKVGVVGAGLMGAEIAFVHALEDHDVQLVDRTEDALSAAMGRLASIYDKGVARSALDPSRKEAVLAAIRPATDPASLADRDLVIEAVFEREDVKAQVLGELDGTCGPDCFFATNTSTIPITVLASHVSLERRRRFIGTHYFSPVSA
jgi:3-hydroxybutyryl-CoA dehydrogenase